MGRPVVLLGCGRLGSAIAEGWLKTGAVAPSDLIILSPSMKPTMQAAEAAGARINPPLEALAEARALVIAVKPAKWREATAPLLHHLATDAAVTSVMAGVPTEALRAAFGARDVVRVMPTTGVARAQGAAILWADRPEGWTLGRALFGPTAELFDLDDEDQMDAATALVGAGPAYFYAFTLALAQASAAAGLDAQVAERMARATLRAASGGLGDESLIEAINRVASPGGVTRAGLDVLEARGLPTTAVETIAAAVARSRQMST